MAENKTRPNDVDPADFLATVENERRRADGQTLLELMRDVTGEPPIMWGPSIIGFGSRRYRTDAGREGDIMLVGFSPRKTGLVLYVGSAMNDEPLMARLGKHKRGKGCLYVNKLEDVDVGVLRDLVGLSVANGLKKSEKQ